MKLWAVFPVILTVVASCLWPGDKGLANSRNLLPQLIKMDMCAEAKKLQAGLAPALPQKSAQTDYVWCDCDGTTVSLFARWNFSREQIIESARAANITLDVLQKEE